MRPRPATPIWVLETNLDDASGEVIGHCIAQLWDAGALDVYTTAIQMKKNRPGVKLSILCRVEKIAAMEAIVFRETGTLGIRRWSTARHVLPREIRQVATAWGPVDGKLGRLDDGSVHFAPEYESCRRIAAEQAFISLGSSCREGRLCNVSPESLELLRLARGTLVPLGKRDQLAILAVATFPGRRLATVDARP